MLDAILSRLYEKRLLRVISPEHIPQHLMLVVNESDMLSDADMDKLKSFFSWCSALQINTVTLCISMIEDAELKKMADEKVRQQIEKHLSDKNIDLRIYPEPIIHHTQKNANMTLNIFIGFSGKEELTTAIKHIMQKVESEELEPEDINERTIESYLTLQSEPELIIRSGGKHLTEFMIWQSVYSELYFTDVYWHNFRKIDFLRAIRDYQKRQRRFGE